MDKKTQGEIGLLQTAWGSKNQKCLESKVGESIQKI